jgi:ribA/ribD-fused uncharacterized protein
MKLKTPEEYGYVVKNGICLFQKGPLSQWWGGFQNQNGGFIPIDVDPEARFNCCEQWMMTIKAVLMDDEETALKILEETNPKAQKGLGRKVRNFDPVVWDEHKLYAVYCGNYWKFTQNDDLKEFLLSFPRKTIFAEAAPWDSIWGIGLGPESDDALDQKRWKGQNLLGKAISMVHKDILDEKSLREAKKVKI